MYVQNHEVTAEIIDRRIAEARRLRAEAIGNGFARLGAAIRRLAAALRRREAVHAGSRDCAA